MNILKCIRKKSFWLLSQHYAKGSKFQYSSFRKYLTNFSLLFEWIFLVTFKLIVEREFMKDKQAVIRHLGLYKNHIILDTKFAGSAIEAMQNSTFPIHFHVY